MRCSSRRIDPLQRFVLHGSTPNRIGEIIDLEIILRKKRRPDFYSIPGPPWRQYET